MQTRFLLISHHAKRNEKGTEEYAEYENFFAERITRVLFVQVEVMHFYSDSFNSVNAVVWTKGFSLLLFTEQKINNKSSAKQDPNSQETSFTEALHW